MLHSSLSRSLFAAAAIFWGVAFGTPASALLITPDTDAGNDDLVTVTATGTFEGLLESGDFSSTDAFGFVFAGPPSEEAALFTTLCNNCGTIIATGGTAENISSFTVSDPFFSIKQDGWIAFFQNTSGGAITVSTFLGDCGTSCDPEDALVVSHGTFFVPGPIVGAGLPGLVLACGGLLALARRRRQQIA